MDGLKRRAIDLSVAVEEAEDSARDCREDDEEAHQRTPHEEMEAGGVAAKEGRGGGGGGGGEINSYDNRIFVAHNG